MDEIINEAEEMNEPITTEDMIEFSAFVGEMTLEAILEGIRNQFDDFIDLDDKRNYIDLFYKQMEQSYAALEDDEEDHPQELRDMLTRVMDTFAETMIELFDKKLAIHFDDADLNDNDPELFEAVVNIVYETFILNGKSNLMKSITKDMLSKMGSDINNISDTEWYEILKDRLNGYSPIILELPPEMYLRYIEADQIMEWYDAGILSGNFFRKYSPRLDKHEEFEVELISNITIKKDVKEELTHAAKSSS